MFNENLSNSAKAAVKSYYNYHRHMAVLHQRIDYLTCRIWANEITRDSGKLIKKGAFIATVKSLSRGKFNTKISPSHETHLENHHSTAPYESLKNVGEAFNLIKELREEYDGIKIQRDIVKGIAIAEIHNLHQQGVSYADMVKDWKMPGFSYITLRNWVYQEKK